MLYAFNLQIKPPRFFTFKSHYTKLLKAKGRTLAMRVSAPLLFTPTHEDFVRGGFSIN